jgi:hypothetical protein
MADGGLDRITTLEELWDWCRRNRAGAWKFPEKGRISGYKGMARIAIAANVPAERWREYLRLHKITLPDEDSYGAVFNTRENIRFYELLEKYGFGDSTPDGYPHLRIH